MIRCDTTRYKHDCDYSMLATLARQVSQQARHVSTWVCVVWRVLAVCRCRVCSPILATQGRVYISRVNHTTRCPLIVFMLKVVMSKRAAARCPAKEYENS